MCGGGENMMEIAVGTYIGLCTYVHMYFVQVLYVQANQRRKKGVGGGVPADELGCFDCLFFLSPPPLRFVYIYV